MCIRARTASVSTDTFVWDIRQSSRLPLGDGHFGASNLEVMRKRYGCLILLKGGAPDFVGGRTKDETSGGDAAPTLAAFLADPRVNARGEPWIAGERLFRRVGKWPSENWTAEWPRPGVRGICTRTCGTDNRGRGHSWRRRVVALRIRLARPSCEAEQERQSSHRSPTHGVNSAVIPWSVPFCRNWVSSRLSRPYL